jgi:hypothetical protein
MQQYGTTLVRLYVKESYREITKPSNANNPKRTKNQMYTRDEK